MFSDGNTAAAEPAGDKSATEAAGLEDLVFVAARQGNLDVINLVNSAGCLVNAQRLDLAAELYRQWLSHTKSPLKYAAAFNLGTVYEMAGDFENAEQAYRRSLAYNPQFAQARFGLAVQLERRGHIEEALAHWRWVSQEKNGVAVGNHDLYQNALANLRRLQN